MVHSGIILLKYWLEVSPDEQTRRLEARIDDGRKIWKLSPMDLKSYSRWYDYSRARDEMFAATDTAWAPWFVARSDDKRRARLNIISHLLSSIPYKESPREKVELPKRQKPGGYREPDYPYKLVTEKYSAAPARPLRQRPVAQRRSQSLSPGTNSQLWAARGQPKTCGGLQTPAGEVADLGEAVGHRLAISCFFR